jgi:hypothetical protein
MHHEVALRVNTWHHILRRHEKQLVSLDLCTDAGGSSIYARENAR